MINRRTLLRSTAATLAGAGTLALARIAPAAPPAPLDDLTIIRRAMALHPGLYRYQSPREFDRRFARFAREWQDQPGRAARFLALSRLTAAVRCGHTQCNPFNQSDAVVADLFDRPTRLPFRFRWLREGMVVLGDSGTATGIAPGSVIRSLNGQTPAAMLRALVPYARADGSNDAKRTALMEMRGDEEFETFDIYQGLLFPPPCEGHRVVWRDPQQRLHSALLPPVSYAARKALLPPAPSGDAPLWTWQQDLAGIVTLTMPTWVTYDRKWDWRGWLEQRLGKLAGARGLIIDIRQNEGGTDCGTWLLQRMISQPLRPLRYLNKVRFRKVDDDLIPYLDTWDRSFRTLGEAAVAGPDGLLILPDAGDEDETVLAPAPPRITVPVAVLMGPINSSATFSFVRRVREARAATLIGAPSGGNLRGINGGAMFFVRLPQSGLEFDLPLKGFFPEASQPDAGILPDIAVANRAEDIAKGFDREAAAARSFLLRT